MVHAVLHRLAPLVPVIDLSHQVAPFDVTGGAAMLDRCAPYLGCRRRAGGGRSRRGYRPPGAGPPDRSGRGRRRRRRGCRPRRPGLVGGSRQRTPRAHGRAPTAGSGRSSASTGTVRCSQTTAGWPAATVIPARPSTAGTSSPRPPPTWSSAVTRDCSDPSSTRRRSSPSTAGPPGPGRGRKPSSTGPAVLTSVASVDRFGNVQLGRSNPAASGRGRVPCRSPAVVG